MIRYPHAGTFEIPIVKNNTRNTEGQKTMSSNPNDAIGINSHVAGILSGADFDGDTVMVIPLSDTVKVRNQKPFKELAGFDNKLEYGPDKVVENADGTESYFRGNKQYRLMTSQGTQMEMGKISNLITDKTLMGATPEELTRAVRHSMVVIDAEKHHLDYKQSEADNGIKALHAKYQGRSNAGASTLISRGETTVNEMKDGAFFSKSGNKPLSVFDEKKQLYVDPDTGAIYNRGQVNKVLVDPQTGKKLYHYTNREYKQLKIKGDDGVVKLRSVIVDPDGVVKYKAGDRHYEPVPLDMLDKVRTKSATSKQSIVAITDNAFDLSAGTEPEKLYANYVNDMKALANKARKESMNIKETKLNLSAAKAYADEVQSLKFKEEQAIMNLGRERAAQREASMNLKDKINDPHMTKEQKGKISQKELSRARVKYGARRNLYSITDKEVAAINAGAIGSSNLRHILTSLDQTELRKAFMPQDQKTISVTKQSRIKNMANSGYTNSEIADIMGLSVSTVLKYVKG